MNGKQQVKAMAKLAGDWKPTELAGYKIGDAVKLPNIEATFQVVGLNPPALLVLQAPSGAQLKAGWRAVQKIRTRAEIEEARP